MYLALHYVCLALFLSAVPLLLVYRARRPDVPWAFVIVAATVLGWVLSNGAVFFQHAAIDEERLEEVACFTNPPPYEIKRAPAPDGSGMETIIENPCGIGDWFPDQYQPLFGLLYGPFYLFFAALPYWLIVSRRSASHPRLPMVLLGVSIFGAEWAVILGKCTALFGESLDADSYCPLCNYVDAYTALPLTAALAFLVSWGVFLSMFKIRQAPRG